MCQGQTFRGNIENFLSLNKHLNNVLVEKYESAKVRRIYEGTLKNMNKNFPQYIDELQGIAQGARVPFFKVSNAESKVEILFIMKYAAQCLLWFHVLTNILHVSYPYDLRVSEYFKYFDENCTGKTLEFVLFLCILCIHIYVSLQKTLHRKRYDAQISAIDYKFPSTSIFDSREKL